MQKKKKYENLENEENSTEYFPYTLQQLYKGRSYKTGQLLSVCLSVILSVYTALRYMQTWARSTNQHTTEVWHQQLAAWSPINLKFGMWSISIKPKRKHKTWAWVQIYENRNTKHDISTIILGTLTICLLLWSIPNELTDKPRKCCLCQVKIYYVHLTTAVVTSLTAIEWSEYHNSLFSLNECYSLTEIYLEFFAKWKKCK